MSETSFTTKFKPSLLARLLAPAGSAVPFHICEKGAEIYCIPGHYSNVYLLCNKNALAIIDVGSYLDIIKIIDALGILKLELHNVKFITATHLHFDHVMGMDRLAKKLQVPIRLSETALEQLSGRRNFRWPLFTFQIRIAFFLGWAFQGFPIPPLSDLREGRNYGFPWSTQSIQSKLESLPGDGRELPDFPDWKVIYTPGHSDESVCFFHENSGILIAGDMIANFMGGEWGNLLADKEEYEKSKNILKDLPVTTILPAHGPLLKGENIITKIKTQPLYLP